MQFQMAFVRTLQIRETMLWVPHAGCAKPVTSKPTV